MGRRVFPKGKDAKGKPYHEMRWSRFKNTEARAMFDTLSEHVFTWLRTLGGNIMRGEPPLGIPKIKSSIGCMEVPTAA